MMIRALPSIRACRWIVCLVFLAVPSTVSAQDTMTFGEEEAENVQKEKDDSSQQENNQNQNEEGMTFEEGEASESSSTPSSTPTVGLVAVPGDAMSSTQRANLREKLVSAMQPVPEIDLDSGQAVLEALRKRNVPSCVTEPLCLGSVGGEADVDRIVMARVNQKDEELQLDIDYFNVSDRLFVRYKSVQNLGSFDDVVGAVEPTIKEMFDLNQPQQGSEPGPRPRSSKALKIVGFSSIALSAGALTAGILFGVRANTLEQDLKGRKSDGAYNVTQVAAQQQLNQSQNKAGLATGFYIASGVLAAAGGTFLFLGSGPSGTEQPPADQTTAELNSPSWQVTPTAGRDGVGVRAQFQF